MSAAAGESCPANYREESDADLAAWQEAAARAALRQAERVQMLVQVYDAHRGTPDNLEIIVALARRNGLTVEEIGDLVVVCTDHEAQARRRNLANGAPAGPSRPAGDQPDTGICVHPQGLREVLRRYHIATTGADEVTYRCTGCGETTMVFERDGVEVPDPYFGYTAEEAEIATLGKISAREVGQLIDSGDLEVVPGTRRITSDQLAQLVADVAVVTAARDAIRGAL